MWWLDPGKEILNVLFNRILAPYVENLDMNQVSYGIGQGRVSLRNLRLKKGALDKFRLPVDVLEGYLGTFTLSLHWMNLGNQPVEILVEDVYLLVVPSPQSNVDPEEEEQRAQAAKAERLENAELLHMRGQAEVSSDISPQSQGLWASLTAKIINNLQVTVKNIHVRYEDNLSVPGHPFAAGITLAGFNAVSVDENWKPAFIESTAGAIHKLSNLQSLAIYFDTDSQSMAGLPPLEALKKFTALISLEGQDAAHQFILKPVSGEGRIILNNKLDKQTPRFDVELFFNEIGIALDADQYRDVISLVDMYHVYMRQHQYRKFRPPDAEFALNPARARLTYAGHAVLAGVHQRHRQWTWAHFAERRDDRNKYVELFKKRLLNQLSAPELATFQSLEKKLAYEDIRFYRSIARSNLRKDGALRKRLDEEKQKQQAQASKSWASWLWGSSQKEETPKDPVFGGPMTEQQRKELYAVLDYDEKAALAESFEMSRDALKSRISAKLRQGSFALRTNPHGESTEILSVLFNALQANVIQRPDNIEGSISLEGFDVFDGTTKGSLHPQVVRVKKGPSNGLVDSDSNDVTGAEPFFFVKFENNPLDERADTALTVRLRHTEVIYHRGYVEAVQKFFKPPASQLESVEALLNVASETLEGFRNETRAGLEYALQTHKTIDIQMDLNSPIIIIPEDITTYNCKHLVIDAGHIAIESDLADKAILQEIYNKRNQQYDEDDYKRLESMMYDKLSLRLDDAQFLIGDNLQSCRDALASQERSSLHLLERTSIDFRVENSIVPSVLTLARFKIAGNLNSLQVNFSDAKYKSLMRLIDACIPKFEDINDARVAVRPVRQPEAVTFSLGPALFRKGSKEYNFEEEEDQEQQVIEDDSLSSGQQQTVMADSGNTKQSHLHQHLFEFDFQVHDLGVCMSKSNGNGSEKPLGDVLFERFDLKFRQTKFDMKVDIKLRSLSMHVVQPGMNSIKFASSAEGKDEDLLTINYRRAQKDSPEFATVYECIDQSVDVQISAFVFRAAPEPVVGLYDFIMTTFAAPSNPQAVQDQPINYTQAAPEPQPPTENKIRVVVNLASVKVILINDQTQLATLSLSTADVTVLLGTGNMRITGRLGSLSLSNDSRVPTVLSEFNQIVSIEGDNLAEFGYETFDPHAEAKRGISSSVYLKAGSVKCCFLERPLHDVYLFITKLAKLKVLYDAATQVAVQKASEIQRMEFNISVNSPILIFPSDPTASRDVLIMRLGEIGARNAYVATMNKIAASLSGIQLTSTMYHDGKPSTLKIIDDIDVHAEIVQTNSINRSKDLDYPDTQVNIRISDVKLHLTKVQYVLLINLSQSIPRVLAAAPEGDTQVQCAVSPTFNVELPPSSPQDSDRSLVDLEPEIRTLQGADGPKTWTTVDLLVSVGVVKLHLYDGLAHTEADFKEHGIARFALNDNSLRFKMLSDGSGEVQIVLKSFTMGNTRVGNSKFREIIPAAQHDRNQFLLLFSMSGGTSGSSLAILTIDSPQIIFAVDPVFALLEFFTIASHMSETPLEQHTDNAKTAAPPKNQSPAMEFRVDLHDVSINVLENDADPATDCIRLTINQVLLSQQGILALTVSRLGMSLMRIGKEAESVRFLDDVGLTLSLDNRISSLRQTMNIDVAIEPLIFRASYRDINMIISILNKAIALYGSSQESPKPPRAGDMTTKSTVTKVITSLERPKGKARVVMTKESLKASIDGFRLVLIGDMHEQPMLHLKIKPFHFVAKDWSEELRATTTMTMQISYWNLTNSHWEPLIDPWTFTASVDRDLNTSGVNVNLTARARLDINLTMTFVELVLAMVRMLGRENSRVLQRARGGYAPYRIWNRSGCTISITSDRDGNKDAEVEVATELAHDMSVDWRFDDWKTMREHVSTSPRHSIKVAFPGKNWEPLQSVPVDREGEYIFSLRIRVNDEDGKKRLQTYPSRILCEVRVEDTVKVVTIRSTFKVENQTLCPLELILSGDGSLGSTEKIAPGHDYVIPIEAVVQKKIKLRPDQGFGYKWCYAFRWEDLVSMNKLPLQCPHADPREPAFQFQAWAEVNLNDDPSRRCPRINLKLRAPIEIENLLPYDIQYRIYDKETDQNWTSYLRKGGIMPVHSVQLDHLIMLSIEVQDTVFKSSDFAIVNNSRRPDLPLENRLTLRDPNERTMHVKMNYVRYPSSGGAFRIQIYSPYIIINKTDLPFWVKSPKWARASSVDVAGDTRSEILSAPIPFLLSHPQDTGNEFCLRIADSTWSKNLNFEAPAGDTELTIPSQNQRSEEIYIGLSWTEGLGKYKLTKIVTLSPRFLIKNSLPEPLSFRAHGVAPQDGNTIESDQRLPLYFLRAGQEKLLTLAYPGLNAQWSPPINIDEIGHTHVRLRRQGGVGSEQLIRADSKIEGSTIFVYLCLAGENWPFVIENHSEYQFALSQTDSDRVPNDASAPVYTLAPRSTLRYAWDYPAARKKRIQLTVNGTHRAIDIKEIGALVPFKFQVSRRNRAVSLDVRADGPRQILTITDYHPDRSLYKLKGRTTSALTRQDTSSSNAETFEAINQDAPPNLVFTLECAGIGLSFVNRKLIEVIYISVDALKIEYSSSVIMQTINLSCGRLEIDNQLHEAQYPVILQPTPIPKDASEAAAPTVQGTVVLLNDREHGVIFIKYCTILLQALSIEVDEDLLFAVYDLTQIKGLSWEDESQDILIQHPNAIPEPSNTAVGADLYFECLQLHPIKLSLSFMRTERVNSEEKLSIRNPLAVVVNALTMTIGNINQAPLQLKALLINDIRLTFPELQNRILYYYRQDVLRQLYRILGSADFIGNPVGLFTTVSSGVVDIFYEPFNGIVLHGNKELGIGIAKGAASFMKKTVFGLSDSVTRFTSSVGKGISAATFDSEYQAERRIQQRRNRPRHVIYGVSTGLTALSKSVASAVEGVVAKPLEGAESGGALGFFKGVGKGLAGAVTKPAVGVFDLASNFAEGIRNTTIVFDDPRRDRARLPRHIPADGVLRPYSERDALGQYMMKDLENGTYRKEFYVAHMDIPGGDNVVLLTATRVLSFGSRRLRLHWDLPLTDVQAVQPESTGVLFVHKKGSAWNKLINITDGSSRGWLFNEVAAVVKTFNQQRQMDG